jgi:hypothetical protein
MFPHLLDLSNFLKHNKEDFFLNFNMAAEKSSLNFKQLGDEGQLLSKTLSRIYDDIVINLKNDEYKLHSQRLVEIGKEIGFSNSRAGSDPETVIDIVILFKNHLWRFLHQNHGNLNLTVKDFFEVEKRINLYLDHIVESIAFAYIATKEQAVIDWVEKMIN